MVDDMIVKFIGVARIICSSCNFFILLTKEDRKELVLVQQLIEHFFINLLDLIFDLKYILRSEPLQDLVFLHEISVVYEWRFLSEIHEGWNVENVIFFGSIRARDLNEVDTEKIGFAVDFLQRFHDFVTFRAVFII